MKIKIRQQLNRRQRRIQRRLDKTNVQGCDRPMFTAANLHYEISDRDRGIAHGGIGALHTLARRLGLIDAIDRHLVIFELLHLPYHESDHVLNLAYNPLCGGTCLEDIELRRNDEAFLDALGARRIPDPTTAGDFCRRFDAGKIRALQNAFHETRYKVWAQQPDAFFAQAILDADGTLVGTTGRCKQGMDISYKGTWGYHPLVISLANTGEVLSIVNRPGNRPSHDGAAAEIDRCIAVCLQGGFRRILVRGDTDFSQTEHLDRWSVDRRIEFIFGYDCCPNLVDKAENLPELAWQKLQRPARYRVKTKPRQRPENVKDGVVRRRQFDTLRLQSEEVAEFNYQPTACSAVYRMVVVRKNITKEKGGQRLYDEIRYFFYITNDWASDAHAIVFSANDRCDQENVLAQMHGGCRALKAPVDNLESNWAYMVMTALSWDLKAWWALMLPEGVGRHRSAYRADKQWVLRLEFRTFVQAFVQLPCQIVRSGRRLLYRLMSWNRHQPLFFRLVDALQG